MKDSDNRLKKELSSVWRKGAVILFWILLWQLIALFVDNEILMVTPRSAVQRLGELIVDAGFWKTCFYSIGRIGIGFVLGMCMGLLLAVLSNRFALLEELLRPMITLYKTIPVASFVVLLLIWWGSSYLAVAICFIIVLPNIYINTLEGIRSTDGKLLEMAKVFKLPLWTRFFYIYRPALRPFWDSCLKLSLGMCWKSGVAAEVIGMPEYSIGEQLYFSKIHLDTAGVFAWTAVIILLSIGFERFVLWLAARFFQWEPGCGRNGSEVEKNPMSNALPGIKVEHLHKSFDGRSLFTDFDQIYEKGKTYYLTEPSGSGKTTLLRILCGLEEPDSGTVTGNDGCSVMFQEDRLCEEYSAVRNIEMVTGNREEARKALLKVLEAQDLEKPCAQLSGGMKRRVALVRALEGAGSCVLLDEPFTGLDAKTREKVEAYIGERLGERILIIATHI